MNIKLDLTKSLEENAQLYFERAKKARKKIAGAQEMLGDMKNKAQVAAQAAQEAEEKAALAPVKKEWYHKYRWSFTRNGLLLVGGQNADANEILIRHQTEANDVVFHTDMAGSPFVILKGDATQEDLEDAAVVTACYSRGWGKKIASLEVFHVKPEQVTKEAQSGEYLGKGAFMIRGETTYHNPQLELGIGVIQTEGFEPQVFVGSPEACKKQCKEFAVIVPGDIKTSDMAKELRKRFGGELDAYVKAIPTGGSSILNK